MTLQAIKPASFPWFPYEGFTFCLGLVEGSDAWTSGHTAAAFDHGLGKMAVSGSMEQQAQLAYEKVLTILGGAGLGVSDVTRITENITLSGLPEYESAAGVRRALFADSDPSIRTVVVERLVRSAALIEVELHAVSGGGRQLLVSSRVSNDGLWQTSSVTEGHDGVVYLPTIVPIDSKGDIVHEGDFVSQYAWCLDRAGQLLSQSGLSLDDVVTTYDYSTPESRGVYRQTHSVRMERLGRSGVLPCAGGIQMSRLHRPGVLVALDVTASRHPLELVNPGWSRYDTLSYSPGVKAGRSLFMSGFAALDMETQKAVHAGDIRSQAEVTYRSMLTLLEHVGLGPADLLETTEYCVLDAIPQYREVAHVREKLLSPPWPASTGAICRSLLRPEFLIEVFASALFPRDTRDAEAPS